MTPEEQTASLIALRDRIRSFHAGAARPYSERIRIYQEIVQERMAISGKGALESAIDCATEASSIGRPIAADWLLCAGLELLEAKA